MNWNGIRLFAFDLDGTVIEGERLGGEAPFLLAEFVRRDGVASGRMLDGRFGFRSATVANAEPEIKEAVRANGGRVSGGAVAAGFCEVLSRVVAATDSVAVSR